MERTKLHSSQYASSLIEASLDPLITIDIDGKIMDINQAMATITGVERKDLIGTNFCDYFTEPQNARLVYQEVFRNGSVANVPLTFRHKNGKLTDVLFNGSVYKDNHGNVLGTVVVGRDVGEQKWAIELRAANKELAFQNNEKEKRAAELLIANKELVIQNILKEKRADEKEKRAAELIIANKELAFQNDEKEKRAAELVIANKELAFQNEEKEKRAAELIIANKELIFQNNEKEKRAAELVIADKELIYQTEEKIKRAAELVIADKELVYQTEEKEKRAAELVIADKELEYQTGEKEKRETVNKELEALSCSLELASQYSRSLIEASLDPLFTINPAGKITDMNNASIKVIGVSREEVLNTDFFEYFTKPDKAREVYQKVYAKGFVSDYPLTIRDGKLTDVLFNGSVYKDDHGNVLGVVVVARDITEQKRIATELTEAKIFAELATGFAEDAKQKAEKATLIAEDSVKAKQQFLSNMSHEIRTPMNAIIGFTKVLLNTELTKKQNEYLNAIKMSGDALIVLINDILDLAKVDAGKMSFENSPFKMAASISAMIHVFEIKIQEKNIKLIKKYDKNIPKVLVGDSVRLHQIILNLLSNAVKFTTKGKITVAVTLLSQDDEKVTIEFAVSDTGIGIAKDKMEHIFENFQQATSKTSRLYGGTGLGLAISKQLVESQGGSIAVKSKIREGSTFSFVLPFKKSTGEAELETEVILSNVDVKNIKILVVEDIALNQLLMKTLLDDFGFNRDVASNGKIAVEMLQKKAYDVILMDLQMPVMNGFEATEFIRKIMKSTVPIIALTADVTTVDLAKCRSVGMNDYISKPVDEKLLFAKIIEQLKKPSLLKEIDVIMNNEDKNIKPIKRFNFVDLSYLNKHTKGNQKLMMEMIALYLEQTPSLIVTMKQSLFDKDWKSLSGAIHKMIPSFAIMGINKDFEQLAKKIQHFENPMLNSDELGHMVLHLEVVCNKACEELTEEYNDLKNASL